MLRAVQANLGQLPGQVLADTGYKVWGHVRGLGRKRLRSGGGTGARGQARAGLRSSAITAYGTDGSEAANRRGAGRLPPRKWLAEAPNGWIKSVLGSASSASKACTGWRPSGSSCAWRWASGGWRPCLVN